MEYLCQDFVSNYRQSIKPTNYRRSDYSAYTTEMAITEYKGENFEKSFTPLWGSYIVPLTMFILAFIPKKKKK